MKEGKKKDEDDLETTHVEIILEDQLEREKKKSLPPPGETTDWEEADEYLRKSLPPPVYGKLDHDRKSMTMEQARVLVVQLKHGTARVKE